MLPSKQTGHYLPGGKCEDKERKGNDSDEKCEEGDAATIQMMCRKFEK
jgi:hypothetical protein